MKTDRARPMCKLFLSFIGHLGCSTSLSVHHCSPSEITLESDMKHGISPDSSRTQSSICSKVCHGFDHFRVLWRFPPFHVIFNADIAKDPMQCKLLSLRHGIWMKGCYLGDCFRSVNSKASTRCRPKETKVMKETHPIQLLHPSFFLLL